MIDISECSFSGQISVLPAVFWKLHVAHFICQQQLITQFYKMPEYFLRFQYENHITYFTEEPPFQTIADLRYFIWKEYFGESLHLMSILFSTSDQKCDIMRSNKKVPVTSFECPLYLFFLGTIKFCFLLTVSNFTYFFPYPQILRM